MLESERFRATKRGELLTCEWPGRVQDRQRTWEVRRLPTVDEQLISAEADFIESACSKPEEHEDEGHAETLTLSIDRLQYQRDTLADARREATGGEADMKAEDEELSTLTRQLHRLEPLRDCPQLVSINVRGLAQQVAATLVRECNIEVAPGGHSFRLNASGRRRAGQNAVRQAQRERQLHGTMDTPEGGTSSVAASCSSPTFRRAGNSRQYARRIARTDMLQYYAGLPPGSSGAAIEPTLLNF